MYLFNSSSNDYACGASQDREDAHGLQGHGYGDANAIYDPALFLHHANENDAHQCVDDNEYVPSLHGYADVYEKIDL